MSDIQEQNGVILKSSSFASVDWEVWARAEESAEEIIRHVRPTVVSEERRGDVIDYVQKLLKGCLGCEVFPFGSVPLKTYLPDGDIDLTAFCDLYFEEAFANDVYSVLEAEERNPAAKFVVKDVQYIRAEVKLIKCFIQNIGVDISFNQIGGLSALCFLEEVDRLIGKDHLYKRSIILIKAWCFYESRTLGAHHGLISTYALETMVLYIFHVFRSALKGPLAVLHKFLDYYSKFDWENFCVSLSGPVHIASLPEVLAEKPETIGRELLLSDDLMRECVRKFSVPSRAAEINCKIFMQKHLNIVDPLNKNNNLGRSVYKGNFFRIRSAFSYGARKIGEILLQPPENINEEVHNFFTNALNIHGKGQRPDVQEHLQLSNCNGFISEVSLPVTEPYQNQIPAHDEDSVYSDIQSSDSREDSEDTISEHKKSGPEEFSASENQLSGDANDLSTSCIRDLIITEQGDDFCPSIVVDEKLPSGDFPNEPHFYFSPPFEDGKMESGFLSGKMEDRYLNGTMESGYLNGNLVNGHLNGKMENGCSVGTGRHDTVNPLLELSGDVGCNLVNLQYGRLWYDNGLSIPLQPIHLAPYMFQPNVSWGVMRQTVPQMNVNCVIPRPAFFPANYSAAYKPRGLGTYFPIVNRSSPKRRSRKSKAFWINVRGPTPPDRSPQAQGPFRQSIGKPEIPDKHESFPRGKNYKKTNGFVQPLEKLPTPGAEIYNPLETDPSSENQNLGPVFGVDDSRFSVKPYQLKDEDFPPLCS